MKVYLDRNHCEVYQPACESCFGGRIQVHFGDRPEGMDVMEVAGCVLEIQDEDDRDNVTFFIKDRDGTEKQLDVNQENWPDAYDSWLHLYETQQVDKGEA